MKKIFLFFVFCGVALGLFLGVRNEMVKDNNENEYIEEESGDNYVHELNIPIMEIDSLNPILTYNKQVLDLMKLVYEPLININQDESLEPSLAIEWAQKSDNNWIIKLRKGVKWHNNSNFTSADVIFTLGQILSESVNSPYKDNLKNILTYEALDEYSVSIVLSSEDEFFMQKLTFPIIPEYYFKNGDILNDSKNNIPIGTGAYKYVSSNADENYIKLARNPSWWNTNFSTRLDTIYLYKYSTYGEAIKAYKSAEVDLIVTTMPDWEKKFGTIGNNVYRYESSIFDTIIPNTKKIALSEASVRKAILTAINRDNIVTKIFNANATVVDFPIHTRSKNYLPNNQSEYDLDKAKQILINAGWTFENGVWHKNISGKTVNLKFSLLVNEENNEQVAAAEIIKLGLEDLGISVSIKNVSWSKYKTALNEGNFDLALASFDIKNELSILDILEEESSKNYSKFTSNEMSKLIKDVQNNYNEENMKALQDLYKVETPYIGLYYRNNTILTNKSVRGTIEPTWYNPYENIITWCK